MARRRRRASQIREAGRRGTATKSPSRSGWRQTIDSYGGFTVIVPVVLAIAFVGVLVLRTPLGFESSEDPLQGDALSSGRATHVANGSLTEGVLPSAGGPHYSIPQRVAAYDGPVSDGNVIHALEHGVVWISYQPDLVTTADIDSLVDIQSDFGRDVILSPRPASGDAVVAISWERRLTLGSVEDESLREFVATNRNRSPEPGIR